MVWVQFYKAVTVKTVSQDVGAFGHEWNTVLLTQIKTIKTQRKYTLLVCVFEGFFYICIQLSVSK